MAVFSFFGDRSLIDAMEIEIMASKSPVQADGFTAEEQRGLYRAIYSRRDIRTFKSDPIPADVLARIIRAAHHGPSVGFMQP